MGDDVDAGETRQRWDFFVSYTQDDRDWAEWIAWQIEDLGCSVLIQAWDFVAGSYWMAMMERGIRDAQHTVAVLSGAYLRSVYGEREWQAALQADPQGFTRRLVPVRTTDCARPGLLGDVVSIDLFDRSEADAARHLRAQIIGVVLGRAKPRDAPRFPRASGFPRASAVTPRIGADESTDAVAGVTPEPAGDAGPDRALGPPVARVPAAVRVPTVARVPATPVGRVGRPRRGWSGRRVRLAARRRPSRLPWTGPPTRHGCCGRKPP